MDYRKIDVLLIEQLWDLQKAYKAEIGENTDTRTARGRIFVLIAHGPGIDKNWVRSVKYYR